MNTRARQSHKCLIKGGCFVKQKFYIIAVLVMSVLFATPVFATQNSDKALEIAQTLERYQVSPGWEADLIANKEMLQELVTVVDNFDFEDAEQLGSKQELVSQYYEAYSALIGSKKEFPQKFDTSAIKSESTDAVEILTRLKSWQVDPKVRGDIVANVEHIEKMLDLVFGYSEEEVSKISLENQYEMIQYFVSLYDYRGWDVKELDLVFTKSQIPLSSITYSVPKVQQPLPPVTKVAPQENPIVTDNNANDYSSIIGAIVGFIIWGGLLALLAVVLKQRNDKKYRT